MVAGVPKSGAIGGESLVASRAVRGSVWPRFGIGCVALVLVSVLALALGPADVSLEATARILASHLPGVGISEDISPAWRNIIWEIRLPRVLLAGAAGATLAMAGATYQGVFRNPLADPYLIGVATGANLAATIVLVSDANVSAYGLSVLPLAAFAGALVSVVLVYGIARAGGPTSGTTLILAGVALSALSTAVTAYLMLTSTTNSVAIMSAVLGGFNTATWAKLAWVLPYAMPAALMILAHGRILNVLSLDEQQARQLGIEVERTKLALLGAASLGAAAVVSVSGTIGFVGLIVPHATRLMWGPDNRSLLPMTIVLGAAFLIGADVLARTIREPAETPVGIITVACGVPFFLYLLVRRSRSVA
jgi:iron complex transport system permease protein